MSLGVLYVFPEAYNHFSDISQGRRHGIHTCIVRTTIDRAEYIMQVSSRTLNMYRTGVETGDATKSVIWSTAESAITIIAISIVILRAFITKKVESAIDYVHNSSDRARNTFTQHSSGLSMVKYPKESSKCIFAESISVQGSCSYGSLGFFSKRTRAMRRYHLGM